MNSNKLPIGLTVFILLLFQPLLQAQRNFENAKIVHLDGETVEGFIDYRNWSKNPKEIKFKSSKDAPAVKYTPLEIKAFEVANEKYKSGIVMIETSPTETAKLEETAKFNYLIDTTFLQTLIDGDKSLYLNKPQGGGENFYIKKENKFTLLRYKKFIRKSDNVDRVVTNLEYLSQLSKYLNDCPDIHLHLNEKEYKRKELVKVFKAYYTCTNKSIEFEKKREKTITEFGAIAGASMASINFSTGFNGFKALTGATFPSSLRPAAGLSLEFIFPRNNRKWSSYNEILLASYLFEDKVVDYTSEEVNTTSKLKIGAQQFKINNFIRYRYPLGKISVFVNLGIGNSFTISETNSNERHIVFYTDIRDESVPAIQFTRSHEQSFQGGLGVKWNKFSGELRYEKGNGMSNIVTLKSSVKRIYLLIGYKF